MATYPTEHKATTVTGAAELADQLFTLGGFQGRGPRELLRKGKMCATTVMRQATGSQTAQCLGLGSSILEAGM